MFSNGRKTIGVFAENTSNEFQYRLCDGMIHRAVELGYNIAIFSAYGSHEPSYLFRKGELQLYQLPAYEDLDGVILVLDTVDNIDTVNHVLNLVNTRCKCPIVSMRMTIPDHNNILVDGNTCMEELIRHFIEFHHAKKICFMTGPVTHLDAVSRLECFKRLMREYDLPIGDHSIFYGDFWKNCGSVACDHFLSDDEKPDAIICANDYMAVSLTSELIRRGYRIPEDILIGGYDGLDYAVAFSPSITTETVPFYEMGWDAVDLIHAQQGQKKIVPKNYFHKAALQLGESCGCMKHYDTNLIALRWKQYEDLEKASHRAVAFSFMASRLAEEQNVEGISDILSYYLQFFDHLRDYAICLNSDMTIDTKLTSYTDTMELRAGVKDLSSLGHVNIPFPRKELLPPEMTGPEPQAWYFIHLHFLDFNLGYEALRFSEDHPAGMCDFQYDVSISNKIHETLALAKMEKVIKELEDSSLHDSLTGLYNRGGFNRFGGQLFESNVDLNKPVFVAVIDMDGLKKINDQYGHIEGDYALKRTASAISKCCSDRYIFARTGGDEFYVIGQGISEEDGSACMLQIEQELESFNESGTKEYKIHVSTGFYLDVPGPRDHLDNYIKVADRFMYHNKLENKKRRGESLR